MSPLRKLQQQKKGWGNKMKKRHIYNSQDRSLSTFKITTIITTLTSFISCLYHVRFRFIRLNEVFMLSFFKFSVIKSNTNARQR